MILPSAGTPQLLRSLTRDPGPFSADQAKIPQWTIFYETLIHDFDTLLWLNEGARPVEVLADADALIRPDAKASVAIAAILHGRLLEGRLDGRKRRVSPAPRLVIKRPSRALASRSRLHSIAARAKGASLIAQVPRSP
jgi:hypothetical protein